MSTQKTIFGSLDKYEKGSIEIIDDDPKAYVFSNIFEVANMSKPYEKVAVAMNLQYVIEALRTEGDSKWFTASHDEFVVCMDGELEVHLVKLNNHETFAPEDKEGSIQLNEEPVGKKMGRIVLKHGHQALLPKGAAYKFSNSGNPGVVMLQTIKGEHTVEKWSEICYS
jgi:hypothetical protein